MKTTMDRRAFLRRLGALGALGFVPGMGAMSVRAAEGDAPLRLVVWYQPNGYGQDPAAVHARSLATLDALRDKIIYLRGMHLPTAMGGHENEMEDILTGDAGGPSFDQSIAAAVGADHPLESLALGVRSEGGGHGGQCSFLSEGNPTPRIERPEDAWASIFAGLSVGEDPEAPAQQEALWARRELIMSKNQQMAEALRESLAGTQRERLDQYIDSIDQIRDEMTTLADTSEGCVIPDEPGETPPGAWNDFTNYDAIADGQISMLTHALSCDLTRVGVLQFNRATSQIDFGQVDGQSYLDQHHALSHLPGNAEAEDQLQQVLDWYDNKLLAFASALNARTDIDGNTMLDNTIIVRVTECMLSNGHEFDEGHHLLIGGNACLNSGTDHTVDNGDPLVKLWLTLSNAMGAGLNSVAGYQGTIYDQLLA